jgi:hypothetical protein
MRLKAMALPSEVLYYNDINGLSEDLAKPGCIETKEISGTPPKLSAT